MRALLLLSLLAGQAAAQLPYQPFFKAGQSEFGLALGVAQPTGSGGLSSVAGRGPAVGLEYLRYWTDWTAWGAGLDLDMMGAASDPGPPGRKGKAGLKSFSLLGRLNLLREESWTPYLLAGVGAAIGDVSVTATAAPGTTVCADQGKPAACAAQASVSRSALGPALTAAAGVETFLFQGLSLSLEGRFTEFRLPVSSADFPVPHGRCQALAIRLGAHLWFGGS